MSCIASQVRVKQGFWLVVVNDNFTAVHCKSKAGVPSLLLDSWIGGIHESSDTDPCLVRLLQKADVGR